VWVSLNIQPVRDEHDAIRGSVVVLHDISASKRAEAALSLYRELIAKSTDAIAIFDLEWRYLEQNAAHRRLLGYSDDDLLGQSPSVHLGEEVCAFLTREVAMAGDVRAEVQSRTKGGASLALELSAFEVRNSAGEQACYVGFARDISERKRAEVALRESEERYRVLTEAIPQFVWTVLPDGTVDFCNQHWSRFTGLPLEESLGVGWVKVLHPDDLPRALAAWEQARESNEGYEIEYRVRRASDGFYRWHLARVRPVQGAMGLVVKWMGAAIDIHDRKQAEDALKASQAFARDIIASSLDMIIVVDTSRRIIEFNHAAEETFGCLAEAVVGEPVDLLYAHPDEGHRVSDAVLACGRFTGEVLNRRMNGNVFTSVLSASTLRNSRGEVIGVMGVSRDITERRVADEQLRESLVQLRTLSRRVESVREEERTRIARELHDQLGVALTCVKLEVAQLQRLLGPQLSKGERVGIEAKLCSMMDFIDGTIGAVQRIVTELRPAILDDLGLVAAIEWQAHDFQKRTGTRCRYDTPQEEYDLDSERATALFRICQEALTNVARHADASEVVVEFTVEETDVVLSVRDNGRGIPVEKLRDRHSLGLLGMQERARLLGGDVQIRRLTPGGTQVEVRLPMASEATGRMEPHGIA
jgi:PAS domain S-box-containing protein